MPVTAIHPAAYSAKLFTEAAASRNPVQTLGQDDFLRLLVTQMSSQDPLNPSKDTDFIAQMAQFSALEQSKAMQADMARMRSDQQLLQATGMIGRVVDLQLSPDITMRGVVSAVQIEAGTPRIVVNGASYDLSQLRSVSPAPLEPTQPQPGPETPR